MNLNDDEIVAGGDDFHFLTVFPREVWESILDKLPTQEKEAVANAFPFFRSILNPTRALFLFPRVWEILTVFLSKEINRQMLTLTNRNSGNGNWYSEVLNLRTVCKTWKDGVDSFHEMQLQKLPPVADCKYLLVFNDRVKDSFSADAYNRTKKSISAFLDHFEQTHVNKESCPFIGRSVDIWVGKLYTNIGQQFVENVYTLLSKYGHHVHCCKVVFQLKDVEAYPKLQEWLCLMPNLKRLEVCHQFPGHLSLQAQVDSLTALVSRNPLPKLPNLKYLHTTCVSPTVINHLVRVNGDIEVLQVQENTDIHGNMQSVYDIYSVTMPNLKHLLIAFQSAAEFEKMMIASEFCPLLEKLSLTLYFGRITPERILWLLGRKWGGTLTQLEMIIKCRGEEEIFSGYETKETKDFRKQVLPRLLKYEIDSHCSPGFF